MQSARLLQLAFPLVRTYGFTHKTLSLTVLSLPTPHTEPLSESAVSSLFGNGDDARRTLINYWMDDARLRMKVKDGGSRTMNEVLKKRLESNEEVLEYLPEAFALLSSPTSGVPPFDPRPALWHASKIADEACYITGDTSTELSWYTRRASLAAIYISAELHQLTSPKTAYDYLDSLLDTSSMVKASANDIALYGEYFVKSWKGIIKGSGIL